MADFHDLHEGAWVAVRRWQSPEGKPLFRARITADGDFQAAIFLSKREAVALTRCLAQALLAGDGPGPNGETLDLGEELGAPVPSIKITEIQVA